MYCRNCGSEISENANYCRQCGENVNAELETDADKADYRGSRLTGILLLLSGLSFLLATDMPAVQISTQVSSRFPVLNTFHIGANRGYTIYAGVLAEFAAILLLFGVMAFQSRRPVKWLRWMRLLLLLYAFVVIIRFAQYVNEYIRGWNSAAGSSQSWIGGAVPMAWIALVLMAVAIARLSIQEFKPSFSQFYVPTRRNLFVGQGESWFRRFLDQPPWSDWIFFLGVYEAIGVGVSQASDPLWFKTASRGTTHDTAVIQAFGSAVLVAVLFCLVLSTVRSVFRRMRGGQK